MMEVAGESNEYTRVRFECMKANQLKYAFEFLIPDVMSPIPFRPNWTNTSVHCLNSKVHPGVMAVKGKGDSSVEFSTPTWFSALDDYRSPLGNIWGKSKHFWLRYDTNKVLGTNILTLFFHIFANSLGYIPFAGRRGIVRRPLHIDFRSGPNSIDVIPWSDFLLTSKSVVVLATLQTFDLGKQRQIKILAGSPLLRSHYHYT